MGLVLIEHFNSSICTVKSSSCRYVELKSHRRVRSLVTEVPGKTLQPKGESRLTFDWHFVALKSVRSLRALLHVLHVSRDAALSVLSYEASCEACVAETLSNCLGFGRTCSAASVCVAKVKMHIWMRMR